MNRSEAGKLGYIKNFKKIRDYVDKQKNDALAKFLKLNKTCRTCGQPISYKKRKNDFCSQSCAASYNNKTHQKRYRKYK